MIVFIIPLKSKRVSKDWRRVCKLLQRCVQSAINQTSESFRVVIACHERPEMEVDHPFIHYVEVDFPPPVLGQPNIVSQMDRDKNQKMWLGLEYAGQFNPSFVMFIDADDCISCRIAEYVNQNPQASGWFFDSGYVYKDGSRRIYHKRDRFYMMSGTSHIIQYSLLHNKDMYSVYSDCGDALHQHVVQMMAEQQTPLLPLPFPGAVYVVQNGENIYAEKGTEKQESQLSRYKNHLLNVPRRLRMTIGSQALKSELIHEFSLAS